MLEVIIAFIAVFIGGGIGYLVAKKINDAKYDIFIEQAKAKAKAIEYEAELVLKDAKNSVLNAEFEAKKRFEDKSHRVQKEYSQKFDELKKIEFKLKEEQNQLLKEQEHAKSLYEQSSKLKATYEEKLKDTMKVLERQAGLTQNEAKQIILQKIEENSRNEIAHIVRKYEEEAKNEAKRKANFIIAQATSRFAGDFAAERLINVVNIKNDELKGRIIGKE